MGQVTTPTNDAPVTYPDRIYNGKDFDTNINRAQSSDNLTTVLTDKNEVLGFPDHTSTQEMQSAIEADRNGSISTYKPTFYDNFIRQPLENMGMAAFQPPFITDIKPTPERAFATSFARAATADVFKPEFSDQEAKANPAQAFAGSLVGSIAAFGTGGALLDGWNLSQLTPFAENIIKGGILGGAYKGISETSNELRDQDHPDLAKIGTGVLHDALWWGGISGLAGAASKPVGVAASAGLGYLMAKSDGADEPTALLNGAVLGGFHLLQSHGEQEDVRQLVTDKLQSNIADYITAKNPMVHEEVAKQGGREFIENHAEDVLDQSPEYKLWLEKNAQSSTPENPNMSIPLHPAEEGRAENEDLLESQKTPAQKAREKLEAWKQSPYVQKIKQEVEKNLPEDETFGSEDYWQRLDKEFEGSPKEIVQENPELMNQMVKNITNQVMLKNGDENATEGRESIEGGSGQETPEGEAEAGVHLWDDGQTEAVGGEEVANNQDKSLRQDQNKTGASLNTGEVASQPIKEEEQQSSVPSLSNARNEQKQSKSQQEKVEGQEKTSDESIPEGEKGTSKIAESINQKAVEDKLTKGFENLAEYEKINVKEQAQKATDLIKNDEEGARSIIRGEKPLPEGLRGTSLITAMEERLKANPDADIAYELANSPLVTETSKAAQELRLAAERTPDSASAKLAEIKKAKVESVGGDKGLEKSKKDVKIKAKAGMDKLNLTDKESINLDKFLDEITC